MSTTLRSQMKRAMSMAWSFVKKSDSLVIIDTTVDDNRIILDHYSDLNDSSLAVEYFKELQEVVIVGGDNLIAIPPENIPALIVMLQTVYKAS